MTDESPTADPQPPVVEPPPQVAEPDQEPAAAPRRLGTFGGMLVALAVTMLFATTLVLITYRSHGDGVRTVPWRPIAAQAKAPLQAPLDLPDGWRATSARLVSGSHKGLHIGTLTTAGRYVALEEAATTAPAYVSELVPGAKGAGTQEVGANTWERRQIVDREGRMTRALIRREAGVTYVVVGTGSWEDLAALVASGGL